MVHGRWEMRGAGGSGWLALLALAAVGCGDCDEEACDAIGQPSRSKVETGIAGSVASSADAPDDNGCYDCSFEKATLELWRTEAFITTADERDATVGTPSDETVKVDGSYSLPLDPGNYLVCAEREATPCLAFQLSDGDLVTVHVKYGNAPTFFLVYDAQGKRYGWVGDFEVLE